MKIPRKIAIITVGRSDYGIYRPLLRRLADTASVQTLIIAAGSHLDPAFGHTIDEIHADGYPVASQVPLDLLSATNRELVSTAIAQGVMGFTRALIDLAPSLAVVLGDRFEMYSAAVAAYSLGIPMAHIHGGELTYGAIDEGFRHSITKLSNLHFPSTVEYASRIIQLGEEPWRISVSGALALDGFHSMAAATRSEIAAYTGLDLPMDPFLITFHPATLETGDPEVQARELLAAIDSFPNPLLFTLPNADPGSGRIRECFERFAAATPRARLVANLGSRYYASVLKIAAVMIGNSSSGLIEAPTFGLPVVNIGSRQDGRVRGRNLIDCPPDRARIHAAIERAISPDFRNRARESANPYYRAGAAASIAARLATEPIHARLMQKRFYDLSGLTGTGRAVVNG